MLEEQMGNPADAERAIRSAIEILANLAKSSPDEPQPQRDLAVTYNNLGYVLRKTDGAGAAAAARHAVETLKHLIDRYPANLQYADDLAVCLNTLAALETSLGHLNNAIDEQQQAIALQEMLTRKAPSVVHHRSDLASSLNNLGVYFSRVNRADDADAAFNHARSVVISGRRRPR